MVALVKQLITGFDLHSWRAAPRHDALSQDSDSRNLVHLIGVPGRVPANDAESFVVALLKKQKEIPYELLLSRLADFLYRKELRAGAWAVDIGLFGSGLFIPDAVRVLQAGKGELWEIE
jgi:hypothetical protein